MIDQGPDRKAKAALFETDVKNTHMQPPRRPFVYVTL